MKLFKTTLTPTSNFATPLLGDTLFGQMCWAIRFTYGNEKLKELLGNYETKPFMIVSDAFASGYLPKPTMPSVLLGENSDDKKANRKKVWLTLAQLQSGDYSNAKSDSDIGNVSISEGVIKNSLNYLTFSTSEDGAFAPYSEDETALSQRDIYFAIDESFSLAELHETFTLLSNMGYGKNTTIGKGFFTFSEFEVVELKNSSKSFMTLCASSIEGLVRKELFYEPFTRFGKHGASLANKNPFKKPLLLAHGGAVVHFETMQNISYIGKAIKGHSSHKETVHQGYAIVVPIKEIN